MRAQGELGVERTGVERLKAVKSVDCCDREPEFDPSTHVAQLKTAFNPSSREI